MHGQIGRYHWAEIGGEHLGLKEVIAALTPHLLGLVAGNISWDSGFLQELSRVPPGWKITSGRVISPPLDPDLLATWPQSELEGGRYDEWYFWRSEPPALELDAFCNWLGTSLSKAEDLAYPGGLDLAAQLALADPEVVVGRGTFTYVIAKSEAPMRRLLEFEHAA
jgi:hypothetical protein